MLDCPFRSVNFKDLIIINNPLQFPVHLSCLKAEAVRSASLQATASYHHGIRDWGNPCILCSMQLHSIHHSFTINCN